MSAAAVPADLEVLADGAVVTAKRVGWFARRKRTQTDGNGFFGFTELQPGRDQVRLEAKPSSKVELEIGAGRVGRVELIRSQ
jgi:hypothetical protein